MTWYKTQGKHSMCSDTEIGTSNLNGRSGLT